LKKMSSFWQILTFKWQFSGGSGAYIHMIITFYVFNQQNNTK